MKKLISLILAIIVCLAVSVPAFAVDQIGGTEAVGEEVVVRAEQTVWYYRLYNGERQKRLWSITYAYWITDWMPYSTPYPS